MFDRAGAWAIVLTRSLPFSIPEAVVCAAGLGGMQASKLLVALSLGSIPTAFVFSAIGAGWDEQPALALAISYVLPIPLLPLVLYLMRGRGTRDDEVGFFSVWPRSVSPASWRGAGASQRRSRRG